MEKFIGCSGFYYNHWKGLFYPENLPKKEWLVYYSEHFNTVEINNTFYRMPEEKALKNWHEITPVNFKFSVKGYRFITHMKKLSVDDTLIDFLERFQYTTAMLKEKLGPVLWQLPGNFKMNKEKLERFCSVLSSEFSHVFEFRDKTWFTQEVFDVLAKYKYGLCIVSAPDKTPEILKLTSDTAYVRFHGKGSWYSDNYSDEDLQEWKNKLENISPDRMFAYFNNDMNAYAVNNGRYFASLFA
jgi:uncharacterized protein YecE (DUF72 family)